MLTAALLAVPVVLAAVTGMSGVALLLIALFALVPASDLATAVVNRDVNELIGPRRLPKLELAHGVPPELATLVAVPALLTDEEDIRALVGRLEVHALANDDGAIRFALLTDWLDAPSESLPEDELLLAVARSAIAELNARHPSPPEGGARFLLLHRQRVWNESEKAWIGWERKRGKLHELNRWLRGARDTTFLSPGRRRPGSVS